MTAFRPVERGRLTTSHYRLLQEMAQKYTKTPTQIAINWLISQPNVIAISKMSSQKHIEENIGATGWTMEETDIELLRKLFPDQFQSFDTPLR